MKIFAFLLVLGCSFMGSAHAAPPPAKDLKPIAPIVCQGNHEVAVDGVLIESRTDGGVIEGNCDVTISNSRIITQKHGLVVLGNSDVTIENSLIQGKSLGVVILDNSTVDMHDSQVIGGVHASENADFNDHGTNHIDQIKQNADVAIDRSNHSLNVDGIKIDTKGIQLKSNEANINISTDLDVE